MLTLDQLQVLDAIERLGTFALAASELHRVPSAISYSVRQAEDEAGFPIFDRSARKARFTSGGARLLQEGRAILDAAGRLERLTQHIASGWEPELHVVVDGVLSLSPVLRCFPLFADTEVPTRLRVNVEYKEGVLARFERDQAQLMLLIGFDPGEDTSKWGLAPLPSLPMHLVASPSYGLGPGEGLELSVRDSRPGSEGETASFSGARDVAWLPDFHAKRLALLEGVGFGWMPEHLIAEDLTEGRLELVRAEVNRWSYEPKAAWRADEPLGQGAARFLEAVGAEPIS